MSSPEDFLLISPFQPLHCHPTSLVPWTLLPSFWKEGRLHQAKKNSHLPQVTYRYLGLHTISPPPLLLWPKLSRYLCQHLLHTNFRDSLSWCLIRGATCILESREENGGTLFEHLLWARCFTRKYYVIIASILPDWDRLAPPPPPLHRW